MKFSAAFAPGDGSARLCRRHRRCAATYPDRATGYLRRRAAQQAGDRGQSRLRAGRAAGSRDAHRRRASTASIDLVGAMRWPERRGAFVPTDSPGHNLWFVRDHVAIAAAKGWGEVAPFFIELEGPQPPGGLPRAGALKVNLRNEHLQYAITWYGLAVVVGGDVRVSGCAAAAAPSARLTQRARLPCGRRAFPLCFRPLYPGAGDAAGNISNSTGYAVVAAGGIEARATAA